MIETKKVMSTAELVEHMDKWIANSKIEYGIDKHTERHVNRLMGDMLNLMHVVRALAKGLSNLESKK